MFKSKKNLVLALVVLLLVGLVGCTKPTEQGQETGESQVQQLDGSLEEIVTSIYETAAIELPKTMTVELNADNSIMYVGIENMDMVEGIASEPMMGSYAHSLMVIRVADGSDIEAVKAQIKENIDPRKWICVGVEPEEVVVENIGNTIFTLIEQDETSRDALTNAFVGLGK